MGTTLGSPTISCASLPTSRFSAKYDFREWANDVEEPKPAKLFYISLKLTSEELRSTDEAAGRMPWSTAFFNLEQLGEGWKLLKIESQLLAPGDIKILGRCEREVATMEIRIAPAHDYHVFMLFGQVNGDAR